MEPTSSKVGPFSLPAQVNHGRWIVACPCGSAQIASPKDPRFWCPECGNILFDRQWVAVEWPPNPKEIERALLERPFAQNRNWQPGESVEALQEQSLEHRPEMEALREQARRNA